MKRFYFLAVVLSLLILPLVCFSQEQEKIMPVEINGDEINYLQEKGKAVVKGHVRMKYQDVELSCDEANYDANTNIAQLKGNVKIIRQGATVYGDDINYDFNTQKAEIVNLKIVSPPIYGQAKTAGKVGLDEYNFKGGYITTCNLDKPHYRLIAKQITVYPKVKVVARNVIMKIGEMPVFYFPYYSHSLKDKAFPFQMVAGKKGDWGYYALGRWRYRLSDRERGRVIFDWYEKRGVGSGLTHKAETTKYGEALANFYYLNDDFYKLKNRDELFDQYPERKNMDPQYFQQERYKARFSYENKQIPDLNIKAEFNKFSDEFFIKDFFYREYEIQPHPTSYALFDYAFSNSALSMLTQGRANIFYTEPQYLPQLQYDFYKQNLGQSGLYLESKNTAGYLDYKYAYSDQKYYSSRAHSHNVFSYPKAISWLHINPYVGNYATYYSRNIFSDKDIWGVALDSGIDFSTKIYKVYDARQNLFGTPVEKFRHIVTPRLSYHYISPPTTSKNNLIPFDEIDTLSRTEAVILALDNKLQARNKNKTWDFVYFSPSLEFNVNKKDKLGTLDKKGTYLSAVKSDLEIYPVEGISLKGDTNYDCVISTLKSANIDLNFTDLKNKKYTVAFGHRYAREYDYNSDTGEYSSQSTFDFTYQLTSKLQFKNYLRYEYKDGNFEAQQYVLRTDLHCWYMDTGLNIDKQREGVTDLTFWVAFTLKDFPDLHVGFDQTYSGAKGSY